MDKKSAKSTKATGQWILGIVFILYLMMDYKTPDQLGRLIDTIPGKVVVIAIFLSLFFFSHPLLGILGLFVGFELIRRSNSTGSYASIFSSGSGFPGSTGSSFLNGSTGDNYGGMPVPRNMNSAFSPSNQFPYTLEEEVVKQMTPSRQNISDLKPAEYKPLQENVFNASAV